MKKQKKEHRHTWDADGDSCNNCGYYTQYCTKMIGDEYCVAFRLCDPSGKCERQDV